MQLSGAVIVCTGLLAIQTAACSFTRKTFDPGAHPKIRRIAVGTLKGRPKVDIRTNTSGYSLCPVSLALHGYDELEEYDAQYELYAFFDRSRYSYKQHFVNEVVQGLEQTGYQTRVTTLSVPPQYRRRKHLRESAKVFADDYAVAGVDAVLDVYVEELMLHRANLWSEYRLRFSVAARLVSPDGTILFSDQIRFDPPPDAKGIGVEAQPRKTFDSFETLMENQPQVLELIQDTISKTARTLVAQFESRSFESLSAQNGLLVD